MQPRYAKIWLRLTQLHPWLASLVRLIQNVSWLFVERILSMVLNLVIGIWMVRYLGPEDFGSYSYIVAFVTLFGTCASLGMDGLILRELVRHPDREESLLGSMAWLRFGAGVLAMFGATGSVILLRPDDPALQLWMLIAAGSILLRPFEVIGVWFQARLRIRSVVLARNIAVGLSFLLRVGLILVGAPLVAFIWMLTIDAILLSLSLIGIYWRHGQTLTRWRYRSSHLIALLREGWPLILGTVAVVVYMRVDQIMLGQMLGANELGLYAAATRIAEISYFIPMAVMASLAPGLTYLREHNYQRYEQRMQVCLLVMVVLALMLALPGSLLATPLILRLYGTAFAEAGPILAVQIWASIFVFLGVTQSTWDVNEQLMGYSFIRSVGGAIINILLNLLLIPRFGGIGAAIATLISYTFQAWGFNLFYHRTRRFFVWQTKALFLWYIPSVWRRPHL